MGNWRLGLLPPAEVWSCQGWQVPRMTWQFYKVVWAGAVIWGFSFFQAWSFQHGSRRACWKSDYDLNLKQDLHLPAFPLISVQLCCKDAGVSEGMGIWPLSSAPGTLAPSWVLLTGEAAFAAGMSVDFGLVCCLAWWKKTWRASTCDTLRAPPEIAKHC